MTERLTELPLIPMCACDWWGSDDTGKRCGRCAQIVEAKKVIPAAHHQELEQRIAHYEERERHFARVLKLPDGGQYRNDWDSRLTDLLKLEQLCETLAALHPDPEPTP